MTRAELRQWLAASGVRPDCWDLDGGRSSETYVLRRSSPGWDVFYAERGLETGLQRFATEDEACDHLQGLIAADPSCLG